MLPESVPPPIYSQNDPVREQATRGEGDVDDRVPVDPQIIIVPPSDSLSFQKGFLGADGERAAIEGELQVKGADSERWGKVCVVGTFDRQASY